MDLGLAARDLVKSGWSGFLAPSIPDPFVHFLAVQPQGLCESQNSLSRESLVLQVLELQVCNLVAVQPSLIFSFHICVSVCILLDFEI